ncbi:MAG: SURF1 family protein [Chloroflexia bacterium]|nr:SURF1 family protein [Chloroflexia bacterium]
MHIHPLLRGAWIPKHLFALTIFITLVSLGIWQLLRLDERRSANAERIALLDQAPLTITGTEPDLAALIGHKVRVTGTYRNEESVVLRGRRSDSGVDGVHLLTPFQLSGSEAAILVDRGWLPSNQRSPSDLAGYAVARDVTLEGFAWAPQVRPDSPLAPRDLPLPGETRIEAWVRVDVPGLQQQVGIPLLPLYIEVLPSADAATLPRPPDPRQLDDGPHLGYALQWFTFAGMMIVVYTILMRQELQRYATT